MYESSIGHLSNAALRAVVADSSILFVFALGTLQPPCHVICLSLIRSFFNSAFISICRLSCFSRRILFSSAAICFSSCFFFSSRSTDFHTPYPKFVFILFSLFKLSFLFNQHFPLAVSLAVLSADIVLVLQGLRDPLHGCDGFTRCAHKFLLLDAWVLCDPLHNSQFLQRAVQSIKLIL